MTRRTTALRQVIGHTPPYSFFPKEGCGFLRRHCAVPPPFPPLPGPDERPGEPARHEPRPPLTSLGWLSPLLMFLLCCPPPLPPLPFALPVHLPVPALFPPRTTYAYHSYISCSRRANEETTLLVPTCCLRPVGEQMGSRKK
eukprot:Sspe_Gene.68873::Locus_40597_Transcript_3_4_Confidence_0.385_Length_3222::g.68873::m.68873